MKHTLLAIAICLLPLCGAGAQDSLKVVGTEPQTSDIFNALEAMDIYLYRFSLKEFLNEKYTVIAYIDEYEVGGKAPKRIYNQSFGNNIKSLNDVPEKYREDFRKEENIPEGKDEWNAIEDLSLYVRKQNDSIAAFTLTVPGTMTGTKRVSLRQVAVDDFKAYFYRPRPFKFQASAVTEETMEIPILLYASAWVDAEYKVIRFCGEKEISPAMNAEILTYVPHYYVVGLRFQKAEAEKALNQEKTK